MTSPSTTGGGGGGTKKLTQGLNFIYNRYIATFLIYPIVAMVLTVQTVPSLVLPTLVNKMVKVTFNSENL